MDSHSGQALPLAESTQLQKLGVHGHYQGSVLDGGFGFPGDVGSFF
jgi:hypothetical protein